MFVALRLELPKATKGSDSVTSTKKGFWQAVEAARDTDDPPRSPSATDDPPRSPSSADHYENTVREKLPKLLAEDINAALKRTFSQGRGYVRPSPPQICIRTASIEYSSLKQILEITGIENAEVRDFVLSMLTVYAPAAFRRATGTDVYLEPSTDVVSDDAQSQQTESGKRRKGLEALGQAWMISNISLIVPFLMSIGVCYLTFLALTHEYEAKRAESVALQSERAEVMKAVLLYNAKTSDWLVTHAGASTDRARSLDDVLLEFVRAKREPTCDGKAPSPPQPSNSCLKPSSSPVARPCSVLR